MAMATENVHRRPQGHEIDRILDRCKCSYDYVSSRAELRSRTLLGLRLVQPARVTGLWVNPLTQPQPQNAVSIFWRSRHSVRLVCRFLSLKQLCKLRLLNRLMQQVCDERIEEYFRDQTCLIQQTRLFSQGSNSPGRFIRGFIKLSRPLSNAATLSARDGVVANQQPAVRFIRASDLDPSLRGMWDPESSLRAAFSSFWTCSASEFKKRTEALDSSDVQFKRIQGVVDALFRMLGTILNFREHGTVRESSATVAVVKQKFGFRCPTTSLWISLGMLSGYTLYSTYPTVTFLPAPPKQLASDVKRNVLSELESLPYSFYHVCSRSRDSQNFSSPLLIVTALHAWLRALLLTLPSQCPEVPLPEYDAPRTDSLR